MSTLTPTSCPPRRARHPGHERVRALPHRLGVPVHRGGHWAGAVVARRVPGHRAHGSRPGQPARGCADLGDGHPHADEGGLCRAGRSAPAHARHWRHAGGELAGQAVFDGVSGLAVHSPVVRPVAARRPDRQLHCRAHPAGGRTVHCHGVCVEPPDRGRPAVHPVASGAERQHHGAGLCTAGGVFAGGVGHHRAVGHTAHLGGAVHRDPRGHCPGAAPCPVGTRCNGA